MPPNPDELKIRTKQLLRFACHQKHFHSGDETSKRSAQSGLLYLGVSDEYSSSRLCLSPAFRLCRLFLRTHQSLTVLTVLSCSPPRFSPPPLLSTPSFSPYSASPSNVTGRLPPSPVFCHVLLPLYPSPSPHPELAACFPSISPLCGIILWMCVKKGAQTFFFGWVSEWGVGGVWEGVECSFAF